MNDSISRAAAIDATTETVFIEYEENADKEESIIRQTKAAIRDRIKALPPVQPKHNAEVSKMVDDCISRQVAQHKINALIDEFETIMKDIRERHVDDSVCGLCEYDGSFISDSGDWCNECPGFERDDCFKLKDQYREEWAGAIKNLPSAQPEIIRCRDCYWWTKQPDSLQGRCALSGTYPTGAFFCGNAKQRPYPCDPEKNTECSKTGCYINGGECRHTLNREYAREEA